jgi:hypothetical protein
MSHPLSIPLRSALGFFHQGFPVIFMKNDVLFHSRDYEDEYLNLIGEDGGAKPGVRFDDHAARAFSRYSTSIHELRHFHDALLCRPLFEQFLRQQKITLAVLQMLNRLAKLQHLPNRANDPIWSSDPKLAVLKQLVDEADEGAFERSTGQYESGMIENDSISLDHLLEASATIAELLHLYAIHGVDAMELYYRSVVLKADKLYTVLIERFVAIHNGNLVRGVDALYCALLISLYGSENPVTRFLSIYSALKAKAGTIREELEIWFANPFPHEDDLARRVYGEWLVYRDSGEAIDLSRFGGHEFPLDELVSLHITLYDARRTLIHRYIKKARCRADFYVEHLHEFAAPAILYYPVEAESSATVVPAILESELQVNGIEHFLIAGSDAEGHRIALAGLRYFPAVASCVSFVATDQMLFANFSLRYLFEGTERLYSRGVDEVYLQTLRRLTLSSSRSR